MNRLQYESSPYLLQHAHNPVDWYAWGDEALQRARDEDKPILVSIGYSACHWCHVMERESFENEQIAAVMNERFVCIKVDREERPDVDAVYMDAVQAMGVRGGWPLNVLLMPDAKPFYGLTYLPPKQWENLLRSVGQAFMEQRDQLAESAEGFARELNIDLHDRYNLTGGDPAFAPEKLTGFFRKMAVGFDIERGGPNRAPKFPMPANYGFLLRFIASTPADDLDHRAARRQLGLTLDRMALGGIYDQIGGGFARYSVDADWFAPHFEKMLYDNAQLLTLYSQAYTLTGSELYKHVVYQTVEFLQRELAGPDGGFYSALDADSEGEEGRFYTWTTEELQTVLGADMIWFADLYHITPDGNWEHGRNILHRTMNDADFAARADWSAEDQQFMLNNARDRLMATRNARVRPGLDDKILASWNGLLLTGLVSAYRAFGEPEFLTVALRLGFFLKKQMTDSRNHGRLWHSYKNGRARQIGFLDDYAAVIEGYLALYQATFAEDWLTEADRLTQYGLTNFSDNDAPVSPDQTGDPLLFFTDRTGEELIARKKELFDNVIPSSNAIMAHNLHTLSGLLDRPAYAGLCARMLGFVQPLLEQTRAGGPADYLTHWASVWADCARPTAEIAIVGPEADAVRRALDTTFYPNKLIVGTTDTSSLPLLTNRGMIDGKTTIYVCYDRVCQLPVTTVADALALLTQGQPN
jgi:uncharacterized protein